MVQCPRHATELYGLCQSLFCNFPISEFISVPQLIELFQLEEDERKKQRERQDRARASSMDCYMLQQKDKFKIHLERFCMSI